MEDAWALFASAALGAIVGGFAAAFGAWLLSRAEHTRQHRALMLAEAIPAFTAAMREGRRHGTPVTVDVVDRANELAHRAVASGRDAAWGDRIVVALAERDYGLGMKGATDEGGGREESLEGQRRVSLAERELLDAVVSLEQHLRRKLGTSQRRSWPRARR